MEGVKEWCTYAAPDEVNLVMHMLLCNRRHTAEQRSLFNALLHRMTFWMRHSARFPKFVLGPRMCVTLQKGNKCVVLFGEEHANLRPADTECVGYMPSDSAMAFPAFLKEWLLRTSVQTDVYLEHYYKLIHDRQEIPENYEGELYLGTLGGIEQTFRVCFNALSKPKTGCYFENVRFHGADIDRGVFTKEVYGFVTPMVKKAIHAMQSGTAFPLTESRKVQFKEQWLKRLNRILAGRQVAKFVATGEPLETVEYALQKVRKNWFAFKAAAPAEYKTAEKALLSRWLTRLMALFEHYLEVEEGRKKTIMDYIEVVFYSVLMDMYTLGRMLKTQVVGPHMILFYGGNEHASRYESVFVKLGYTTVEKHPLRRGYNCIPSSALTHAFAFTGATFNVRAALPSRPSAFYQALENAEAELNLSLLATKKRQ